MRPIISLFDRTSRCTHVSTVCLRSVFIPFLFPIRIVLCHLLTPEISGTDIMKDSEPSKKYNTKNQDNLYFMSLQLVYRFGYDFVGNTKVPNVDDWVLTGSFSRKESKTIIREEHREYLWLAGTKNVASLFVLLNWIDYDHATSRIASIKTIFYAISPVTGFTAI